MEITTLGNLVALAIKISGLSLEGNEAHLSYEAFTGLVKEIFDKINLLSKWERDEGGENENPEDEFEEESDDEGESEVTGREPTEELNPGNAEEEHENDEDEVLNFHYGTQILLPFIRIMKLNSENNNDTKMSGIFHLIPIY